MLGDRKKGPEPEEELVCSGKRISLCAGSYRDQSCWIPGTGVTGSYKPRDVGSGTLN